MCNANNGSSVDNKSSVGRIAQRRGPGLRADNARDTRGPERGMNLQTKVHLAAIAQGEDDADLRDTDRKFAAINTSIASLKTLMSFKMQCYSCASNEEEKAGFMKGRLMNMQRRFLIWMLN